MKATLARIYRGIVKIEEFLSRALLLTIILLTFIAALSRASNYPLPWSLELTLLLFAWFSFLAGSQATRRKANMGVDFLVRLLPKTAQNVVDLINKLLILIFLGYVGAYAVVQAVVNFRQQIDSLRISYSFITLSLAAGALLMMISIVIQIVQRILIMAGKATEEEFEYLEEGEAGDTLLPNLAALSPE